MRNGPHARRFRRLYGLQITLPDERRCERIQRVRRRDAENAEVTQRRLHSFTPSKVAGTGPPSFQSFLSPRDAIAQLEHPSHAAVADIYGVAVHHWAAANNTVYSGLVARSHGLLRDASLTE